MSHGGGEVVANEPIGLAEAITAVRGELARAQVAATGLKRFEVGDITVEFTVALSRDDSADVGIRAWVLSLGADRSESRADTHQLTITLHPTAAQDDEPPAGDSHSQPAPST